MNESGFMGQADLKTRVDQAVSANPEQAALATPEENFQYADLVRRAMMFMTDTRSASPDQIGSPSDNFLDAMRKQNLPLEQSMGASIGNMLVLLTKNAKDQGYEYESEVILGASDEITKLAYLLADAGGVINEGPKSLENGGTEPEFMGGLEDLAAEDELFAEQLQASNYTEGTAEGEGILDQIDYDFSAEEIEFLDRVELEVARYYGEYMKRTGQLDQKGFQELGQRMVMGEYESGALEEGDIGVDQAAAEQMLMDRSMGNG